MSRQARSCIFMVKPVRFHFNAETAVDNQFQKRFEAKDPQGEALREFNAFVAALRAAGVEVLVFDDIESQNTPDSIFPNNWVSLHENGTVLLYPMCAESRRPERRRDILHALQMKHGFHIEKIIDYSPYENLGRFLEGTGSIIFDHVNRIGYAAVSVRTDEGLFRKVMKDIGYEAITFHSVDEHERPIYHTNVLMSVGESFVVICWDTVKSPEERRLLTDTFKKTGKRVIEISAAQMNSFAGNVLEVANQKGDLVVAMSTRAYDSLTEEQIKAIEETSIIVTSSLDTIETLGGGGARCMMAEVGLPRRG